MAVTYRLHSLLTPAPLSAAQRGVLKKEKMNPLFMHSIERVVERSNDRVSKCPGLRGVRHTGQHMTVAHRPVNM